MSRRISSGDIRRSRGLVAGGRRTVLSGFSFSHSHSSTATWQTCDRIFIYRLTDAGEIRASFSSRHWAKCLAPSSSQCTFASRSFLIASIRLRSHFPPRFFTDIVAAYLSSRSEKTLSGSRPHFPACISTSSRVAQATASVFVLNVADFRIPPLATDARHDFPRFV